MIIESENQYQQALKEVENILTTHGGVPPADSSTAGARLQELMSEIKIYENRYHSDETEIPTYEFWTAKAGAIKTEEDKLNPDNFEIAKVKENELTQQQIHILVGEFISNFEKLPAVCRRMIRQKLRY